MLLALLLARSYVALFLTLVTYGSVRRLGDLPFPWSGLSVSTVGSPCEGMLHMVSGLVLFVVKAGVAC